VSPRAGRLLRVARIVVALAAFTLLAGTFVDLAGWLPPGIGASLAAVQFVPSSVALITGASLSLACVVIALVTLLVGRVYCSTLCPLGILQDIVLRIRRLVRRKAPSKRPAKPHTVLRHVVLWSTMAALLAGAGGIALPLVDPYSQFGRIAGDLFRPLATLANNAWASGAAALGWQGFNRFEIVWAPLAALVFSACVLAVIVALAWRHGRLYCNAFCPVGTLLGGLARNAVFRLEIDREDCRKCAECLGACKSHCIDVRDGAIDFSRCVACFDCLDVCRNGAIGFRFSGLRPPSRPAPLSRPRNPPAGVSRRAFFGHAAATLGALTTAQAAGHHGHSRRAHHGARSRAIAPPGAASVARFLDRCTACHLCVSACPTHVLQPATLEYGLAGWLKPHLDYSTAFCNFDCRRCGEVCPDGAIAPLDLATKHVTKIGRAKLELGHCIVVKDGTDCAACSEHCPTKAVFTVPWRDNLRKPSLDEDLCIGCGACEFACPVKAITVSPLATHGIAKQLVEPKAESPRTSEDFPF
jgi:ferredoxin-type protein NapF